MPLYEYYCETCGNNIEKILPINEAKDQYVISCTICKEVKTFKKSIGNSGGFRLNGSGWFKDGYSKDSKPS